MLKVSVLRGYILTTQEDAVAKEINYMLEAKHIDASNVINIQMTADEIKSCTTFYVWYKIKN